MCFLSSRCHMSLVLMRRSISFPSQLVRLIGRWLSAFDLSFPLLSTGIMMASLQTCGTVPVLHPSLNSCSSLFLLRGPRCSSISFVMLSGPGAFFSFSIVKASSSSLVTNGEFVVDSSWWTRLACCSSLISLLLSVRTCRSLISAYYLTRMLAACSPAHSFPSCSRMICELFGFSSLRAATRF